MASPQKLSQQLTAKFAQLYGDSSDVQLFFAPGRVNLMGDHIDYCGGKCLPAALTCGTYLAARKAPNNDAQLHLHSVNHGSTKEEVTRVSLSNLKYEATHDWCNYPKGVVLEYQRLGVELPALELLYWGQMPVGAALSSSSSILIVTALAIQQLSKFRHCSDELANRKAMIKLCHHSEVEFNQVNCGTLDQAAVSLGRQDHAMLLNCASLDCDYIKLNWGDNQLVIVNSGNPRQLQETAYNERRQQAEQCLQIVQKKFNINNLGELIAQPDTDYSEPLALLEQLGGSLLHKRGRHIFSEMQRTLAAAEYLRSGQLLDFAKLLNSSHASLRDDYEVTGYELDTLVDESMKLPGVLGARMTGGGFVGCIISLLESTALADYQAKLSHSYAAKTGYQAQFIQANAGAGAYQLT